MKILFDTNVLVSNFLPAGGQCYEIVDDSIYRHELYCTSFVTNELKKVFKDRFNYPDKFIHDMFAFIDTFFIRGETAKTVADVCRDPNDNQLLADAVLNHIDVIITGDKDLLVLKNHQGIRIISPKDYWSL